MTILEKKLDALMRFAAADNEFEIANIRTEIRLLLCESDPAAVHTEKEQEVRTFLLRLNTPEYLAGYPYLVEALLVGMEKEEATANMTWGIYAPIAVEHSTTIDKVTKAIQVVIDAIWDKAPYGLLAEYFSGICNTDKDRPSPKRFIARAANVIQLEISKRKEADRKCL